MTTDLDTIALLRDSAERYARDQYDLQRRRAVLDEPGGCSVRAWRDYAQLGWLALRLPEDAGGLDADAAAIGAVMEVVGGRLLMEPLLASVVVGTGLVLRQASDGQKAALLPRLADGSFKLAWCDLAPDADELCTVEDARLFGQATGVLHGHVADRLIVPARDAGGALALYLADPAAPGLERRCYRLVDGRGAANVRFTGAAAERLGPADGPSPAAEAIAQARDEAAVALCAEALGAVCALLSATTDYLKVREQFGRPIGANQALQHRMVELHLLVEEVRALTRAAQRALALPAAERARIVSGARAYVIAAARKVANEAVQMHGGVGITEELEVSHHFRRLMASAALFGSRDAHFGRFLDATLGPCRAGGST